MGIKERKEKKQTKERKEKKMYEEKECGTERWK